MLEPFRAAGTYLDRGIDPSSHTQPWHYYLQLLTYSASGGLRWSEGLVLALAVVGTIAAWRRSDGSSSSSSFWPRYLAGYVVIAGAYLFGDSLQDALEPAAVLCRRVRARRGRVRGAREQEPLAAWSVCCWSAALAVGSIHLGCAGLARGDHLRRRSAQSVRLRPDRSRRRPHGGAHPQSLRDPSRWRADAGVGDCAPVRTVAAAVVPPGHAERRLLDGSRRRAGAAGTGHRLVARAHACARAGARRSVRVGVLRTQARTAPGGLHRPWPVGSVSRDHSSGV